MSNDDVADRRRPHVPSPRKEPYGLDTFRAEMRRRMAAAGDNVHNIHPPSRKRKIPTGAPKLGESARERRARLVEESRRAFFGAIVQAAQARLELLAARKESDVVECPWSHLNESERIAVEEQPDRLIVRPVCTSTCRCGGTGAVNVGMLRAHYERMVAEYQGLA